MGWLSDLIEGLVPGAIEDAFKKPLPQITPPDISFKPFTVSGPTGGITAGPGGTTYTLSPEQQAMQNQLFGGAGQFFTQAAVPTAQRETDIFNRMLAAQSPEQQRQRLALEERMLAQGRSGVQTAQYGGAPEQLAFEKAIAESQNTAMLTAMQQAQAEQAQQASLGGQFLQQSYAPQAALLSAFSPALNVAGIEDVARRQAGELSVEAQMANIQGMLGQQTGLAGLYGGIYGNLLGGLGGLLTAGDKTGTPWWWDKVFSSDVRLKENITKVGTTADGINLYTWDWTEDAKSLVKDQPAYGVIAQEVQHIIPEAVSTGTDGYLMVNYSKIFNRG